MKPYGVGEAQLVERTLWDVAPCCSERRMPEEIPKVTIDKFAFLIPKALSYSEAGI